MATVNDAALTASNGSGVTAIEGAPLSTTVATFTDANPLASPADFAGTTIDWGDGSLPTPAIVTLSGGTFSVSGTHTYADESHPTSTAYIVDDGSSKANATDAVTVNDAALTAKNGIGVPATEGASVTTTVATFTDANTAAGVADLAGTQINWGDGSLSTATVTLSGGVFNVSGTHAYAEEGPYSATALIIDDGGSTASATDLVTVADAALHATAAEILPTSIRRMSIPQRGWSHSQASPMLIPVGRRVTTRQPWTGGRWTHELSRPKRAFRPAVAPSQSAARATPARSDWRPTQPTVTITDAGSSAAPQPP